MIDLFSLLPKAESVKLLRDFDRIAAMPMPSEEFRRTRCLEWLALEYPIRVEEQRWRKRDVTEYRAVMAKSQPRLRD